MFNDRDSLELLDSLSLCVCTYVLLERLRMWKLQSSKKALRIFHNFDLRRKLEILMKLFSQWKSQDQYHFLDIMKVISWHEMLLKTHWKTTYNSHLDVFRSFSLEFTFLPRALRKQNSKALLFLPLTSSLLAFWKEKLEIWFVCRAIKFMRLWFGGF